ncbi:hypothetical protein [Vibrio crassostreae]|uniref:hypothetical protein n=1 Tax=Vibrio crassostreae TaxID=246167 RepID=UPI001BD5DECC|nr:hypothetical protein [Vibrio crassostreae]
MVVWLTVLSLIYQRGVNFKIELWLSHFDYENRTFIIKVLQRIYKNKLFVYPCHDDKSMKKINSFNLTDERIIGFVTADDDVYYPSNWLCSLVENSHKSPVIFNRGWDVVFSSNVIAPYSQWSVSDKYSEIPFFTGVGGVFYSRLIANKIYLDSRSLKSEYINADDVLLNYLVLKYGIIPLFNAYDYKFTDWFSARFSALGHKNVTHGRNDVFIEKHYRQEIENYVKRKR